MTKHRIEIDLSSAGWRGWLAFALLAIPLLVLSFFFFAALVVLIALTVLAALVRLYWRRHDTGARERGDAAPPNRLPPPAP